MTRDRDRGAAWFWAILGALWLFLAVMAYLTPIILDDWYQVGWLRHHALTLGGVVDYARYNYFHYNPRLGETFLLLVNGPRWIHVALTPAIELGLVFLVHAIALGRWPRRCARDALALIVIQALLWAASPAPGLLWFYRPFTTNYLYGFCLHLLVLVPYRFALAGRDPSRAWLAPALLAGGVVAGLGNEHTGPATIVAIVVVAIVLVRRGVRRLWLAAGAIGLTLGYAALYFAPGQGERYGGIGAGESRLGSLAERGVAGSYDAIVLVVVHAQAGILLALLAIGAASARGQRRGVPVRGPDRDTTLGIAGLVAWAGAILVTLLLSPRLGERLYFASTTLLVIACVVALDPFLQGDRGLARVVAVVAAAIVVVHVAIFVHVQLEAHADADDRLARLEAAPPGTIAVVPPFRHAQRARWFWGDDFVYASLREYVAHEVFGLAGIEIEGAPRWVEPTPPFRLVTAYRYDPPLDRAALAAAALLPDYTASYYEWALAQQRKLMPSIAEVGGHVLREIDVTVESDDPAVRGALRGRPLYADRYRDGAWSYVYVRHLLDDDGWPTFAFSAPTLPAGITDAYVVGCGAARPAVVDADHLDVSFQPRCPDTHVMLLCTRAVCWLGGTYARFER